MEAFDRELFAYLSAPASVERDNRLTVLFQWEDDTALCNVQAEVATEAEFDEYEDCERDEDGSWYDVTCLRLIEDTVSFKVLNCQVMDVLKVYDENFNKETFEKELVEWANNNPKYVKYTELWDAVIEEIQNNNNY